MKLQLEEGIVEKQGTFGIFTDNLEDVEALKASEELSAIDIYSYGIMKLSTDSSRPFICINKGNNTQWKYFIELSVKPIKAY